MGAILAPVMPLSGMAHDGPHTHEISMEKFVFSPPILTVKVGDSVEWVNKDFAPHTATAMDASFESGELAKGARASIIMSKAGVFEYRCRYHPHMTGRITVENKT